MDTWTLQMGYPVVTVKRNGNKATLTQEHFLLDRNAVVTEPSKFKYVTQGDRQMRYGRKEALQAE